MQAFSSAAALCLAWIAGGVVTRAFQVDPLRKTITYPLQLPS
jgi:hypothetical protein